MSHGDNSIEYYKNKSENLELELQEVKDKLELEVSRRQLYENELKEERQKNSSSLLTRITNSEHYLKIEVESLKQENSVISKERAYLREELNKISLAYKSFLRDIESKGVDNIKHNINIDEIADFKEPQERETNRYIPEPINDINSKKEDIEKENTQIIKSSSPEKEQIEEIKNNKKVDSPKEKDSSLSPIINIGNNLQSEETTTVVSPQKQMAAPTRTIPPKFNKPPEMKNKPPVKAVKPQSKSNPFAAFGEVKIEENFEKPREQTQEINEEIEEKIQDKTEEINKSNTQLNTSNNSKEIANDTKEINITKVSPTPIKKEIKDKKPQEYDWDHLIDPVTDSSFHQINNSMTIPPKKDKKDQISALPKQINNQQTSNNKSSSALNHFGNDDDDEDDHFTSLISQKEVKKPINPPKPTQVSKPIVNTQKPIIAKTGKPQVTNKIKAKEAVNIFGEEDEDIDFNWKSNQ